MRLVQDLLHIVAENLGDPFLGNIQRQESAQFPGDLMDNGVGTIDHTAVVDVLEAVLPADIGGEGAAELKDAVGVLGILGDLFTLTSAFGTAAGMTDDKGGIGVLHRQGCDLLGGGAAAFPGVEENVHVVLIGIIPHDLIAGLFDRHAQVLGAELEAAVVAALEELVQQFLGVKFGIDGIKS